MKAQVPKQSHWLYGSTFRSAKQRPKLVLDIESKLVSGAPSGAVDVLVSAYTFGALRLHALRVKRM